MIRLRRILQFAAVCVCVVSVGVGCVDAPLPDSNLPIDDSNDTEEDCVTGSGPSGGNNPDLPTTCSTNELPPGESESLLLVASSPNPINARAQFAYTGTTTNPFINLTLPSNGVVDHMIQGQVHMKHSRFWRRVGDTRIIDPGTEFTTSITYTTGTSSTVAESMSYTLGAELSAGWGPFSASINTEFSETFETSFTFDQETSVTEQINLPVDNERITIFSVWHLYDQYDFVKADGTDFTAAELEQIFSDEFIFPNPDIVFTLNTVSLTRGFPSLTVPAGVIYQQAIKVLP